MRNVAATEVAEDEDVPKEDEANAADDVVLEPQPSIGGCRGVCCASRPSCLPCDKGWVRGGKGRDDDDQRDGAGL